MTRRPLRVKRAKNQKNRRNRKRRRKRKESKRKLSSLVLESVRWQHLFFSSYWARNLTILKKLIFRAHQSSGRSKTILMIDQPPQYHNFTGIMQLLRTTNRKTHSRQQVVKGKNPKQKLQVRVPHKLLRWYSCKTRKSSSKARLHLRLAKIR